MPGARRRRWAAGLSKRMNRSLSRLDHHQERASRVARACRFREQREIFCDHNGADERDQRELCCWPSCHHGLAICLRCISDACCARRRALHRSPLSLTRWPLRRTSPHPSPPHVRAPTRLLKPGDQLHPSSIVSATITHELLRLCLSSSASSCPSFWCFSNPPRTFFIVDDARVHYCHQATIL